jgi:hypothetical protein
MSPDSSSKEIGDIEDVSLEYLCSDPFRFQGAPMDDQSGKLSSATYESFK